jgi:hypothetical protein
MYAPHYEPAHAPLLSIVSALAHLDAHVPELSSAAVERDRLIASALRARANELDDEMESCARQHDDTVRLAEAFQAEFFDIHDARKKVQRSLDLIEQRLVKADAYYCDDAQVSALLAKLANVGADTRRFCSFMRVSAIARIPAHRYDEACAALEAKRRRGVA